MAVYFEACIRPDSPASRWYMERSDDEKRSYRALEILLKTSFADRGTYLHSFAGLFQHRITENDTRSKSTMLAWVDTVEETLRRIPENKLAAELRSVLVYELLNSNIKAYLNGKTLQSKQPTSTLSEILQHLREMPATDVDNSKMPASVPLMLAEVRPASEKKVPVVLVGKNGYYEALNRYTAKYGEMVYFNIPVPLTPGTEPAGSGECFRCGLKKHRGDSCNNFRLPSIEQKYRAMMHRVKKSQRNGLAMAVESQIDGNGKTELKTEVHTEIHESTGFKKTSTTPPPHPAQPNPIPLPLYRLVPIDPIHLVPTPPHPNSGKPPAPADYQTQKVHDPLLESEVEKESGRRDTDDSDAAGRKRDTKDVYPMLMVRCETVDRKSRDDMG